MCVCVCVCVCFVLQLQEEYKKADKSLNRYNYVTRIGEIIKTVKKQEVEIQRILADTLQVQREISSAEESLGRAYTLADEVIFRGAKSSKSVEAKDMYVHFSTLPAARTATLSFFSL